MSGAGRPGRAGAGAGLGAAGRCFTGVLSPQVPAVPAGWPPAADLPPQLLHAGGAARRAAARGHGAVPRLHGVSARGGRPQPGRGVPGGPRRFWSIPLRPKHPPPPRLKEGFCAPGRAFRALG